MAKKKSRLGEMFKAIGSKLSGDNERVQLEQQKQLILEQQKQIDELNKKNLKDENQTIKDVVYYDSINSTAEAVIRMQERMGLIKKETNTEEEQRILMALVEKKKAEILRREELAERIALDQLAKERVAVEEVAATIIEINLSDIVDQVEEQLTTKLATKEITGSEYVKVFDHMNKVKETKKVKDGESFIEETINFIRGAKKLQNNYKK